MRLVTIFAALAVPFAALSGAYADDDRPGADWMKLPQVAQQLAGMGYTDMRKIEADDGRWKADATKDGERFKIDLDPVSGKVIKARPKHRDDDD